MHRIEGHSDFRHELRCFGYYQGIYTIYKESQLRLDEGFHAFKQMMKADYEPKYTLTDSDDPYN